MRPPQRLLVSLHQSTRTRSGIKRTVCPSNGTPNLSSDISCVVATKSIRYKYLVNVTSQLHHRPTVSTIGFEPGHSTCARCDTTSSSVTPSRFVSRAIGAATNDVPVGVFQ